MERWSLRMLPGHQDNKRSFLALSRKLPETPTCPHPHPVCSLEDWKGSPGCVTLGYSSPVSGPRPSPGHSVASS